MCLESSSAELGDGASSITFYRDYVIFVKVIQNYIFNT